MFELAAKNRDALRDSPAVDLQLRFARTSRSDPAAEPRKVDADADEIRLPVTQLRQLYLEFSLAAARVTGEYLENHHRTVDDRDGNDSLEVFSLPGSQLVEHEHDVRAQVAHDAGNLCGLSAPDERARIDSVAALHDRREHGGTGRRNESFELLQLGLEPALPIAEVDCDDDAALRSVQGRASRSLKERKMMLRLMGLAVLAVAAMFGALLVGGAPITAHEVASALIHPSAPSDTAVIVWQLRMPRVFDVAFVGAALATAGTLLQGLLRNPLVDPYLTGVSAGAAAAIAIALLAGAAVAATPAIGFTAGLGTAVLVAALARRGSGLDPQRLILAGVSLSAFFSAVVAIAIFRAQSGAYANAIIAWLAGSPAGRGWHDLAICLPYAAVAGALMLPAVPALNALRIGDQQARSAGVDLERIQWLILASAALLAACSVELAGMIGFVGLLVPHVSRRLVGTDARALLPASALTGITVTVVADAICRAAIAPAELPLGVLLAFVGVPLFLYLYLRRPAQ